MELQKEIKQFPTYNSFFTRKLKKETRPIENSKLSIVSPVDGRIVDHGLVEACGIVKELGAEVDDLNVGDHVVPVYVAK